MDAWIIFLIAVVVLVLLAAAVRIVKQYERGVVLRFGRLVGVRNPSLLRLDLLLSIIPS